MKKVFLKSFSVFMAILLLVAQSQSLSAKTIDLGLPSVDESALVLDESSLNQAFAELNVLDTYVSQNEGVTYNDLQASKSELILNVSDNSSPMGMLQDEEEGGGFFRSRGCIYIGIASALVVGAILLAFPNLFHS